MEENFGKLAKFDWLGLEWRKHLIKSQQTNKKKKWTRKKNCGRDGKEEKWLIIEKKKKLTQPKRRIFSESKKHINYPFV